MNELSRANKVTVNVVENGTYKADFYRTHKHICTVNSADTAFEPVEGMTKSGVRELFRAYVIEHAEEYGVEWNPADLRADSNIRKSSYATDEELVEDAMEMVLPMMKQLADSCRYGVEWRGITHDDITPMTHTGKGTPLSSLGIADGKYEKSGKWAWAYVGFTVTLGFKGEEVYMPVKMELVSGQLKKPKIGITLFTDTVKQEIIDAGLATADELDPPKEKSKAKATEEEVVEPVQEVEEATIDVAEVMEEVVEEVVEEPKPKRRSRGKKNAEVAE